MTKHQMDDFIHILQRSNYNIKRELNNTIAFKDILIIKAKCFLSPKILITFTDAIYSKGEDFLVEIEELNKRINNNKPIIVIVVVSMDNEFKENLWFNGNVYVHIVVHNEKLNCIFYEKDFHYMGSKNVKKLINIMKQVTK